MLYGEKKIKLEVESEYIGIFQHQYNNNKPLTVVKPGTQT